MGTDLFSIGVSGLSAAQAALSTTSNNIANAATPGYSRQVADLQPLAGQQTTFGYLGKGVQATTVSRQTSIYLNANVQTAQSTASQQTGYYQQVSQLSQMLASSGTDIGSSLQNFFTGLQQVASDPASIPSRQKTLSNAQILTEQFQTVGTQINGINDGLNQLIRSDVGAINNYASQIATLNQSIKNASQGGTAQQPNDLLDQRDAAVQNLSKLIGTSVVHQTDGSYNVFIGNGQGLVVGSQPYAIAAVGSTSDPAQLEVAYSGSGTNIQMAESAVTGGDLGALLKFRSESLVPASQKLGQLAVGFSLSVNAQHAQGWDLSGAAGGTFFNVLQPQAAASTLNQGSATLSVSLTDSSGASYPQLFQASDYKLSFDGSNYQIRRTSDSSAGVDTTGTPIPAGTTYTAAQMNAGVVVDGLNFTLSPTANTLQAGDSYLVKPFEASLSAMTVAISDPAKIAAAGAAPVAVTALASNTGTGAVAVANVSGSASIATPITITFANATTYTASQGGVALPGANGAAVPANNQIIVNGVTVTLSGAPSAGDAFTLAAATGGVGDNQNANLMAALQSSNQLDQHTVNFAGLYSSVVSDVGSLTAQYKSTSTSADGALSGAVAAQQALSGVNLDEEAANLIKFQQQYQACAKVVQIASTLFQSILQI